MTEDTFDRAVKLVLDNKVKRAGPNSYEVNGNDVYTVYMKGSKLTCSCANEAMQNSGQVCYHKLGVIIYRYSKMAKAFGDGERHSVTEKITSTADRCAANLDEFSELIQNSRKLMK